MEGRSPRRAVADLASVPTAGPAPGGWHPCPDDLPDGLVIADPSGRVTVFNRAAARLTGISAVDAVGADVRRALQLRDTDGRCWWTAADPYRGLPTRTRLPERSLYLPDGAELLVTVGLRAWSPLRRRRGRAGPAAVPGDQLARGPAAGTAGAQPRRPGHHRRA